MLLPSPKLAVASLAAVGVLSGNPGVAAEVPGIPVKSETARVDPKKLTLADYYVPLDNWLKAKGSPLAGHAKELVEESRAGRIDPDFVLAVGYAETNLGIGGVRQRGSEYNLWSVASFDSTNTTLHPTNFRNAIRLTVRTLNNELLGRWTTVGQLSGYRNPRGPVYATSPTGNWERNVTRILSELKGRPIDYTYQFRK